MGRYKEYREPRRRGYDDDQPSSDREENPVLSYMPPPATLVSEPLEAAVKWFNSEKGFGFVALLDGTDAFLPARALEAAGAKTVTEGTRLRVRTAQGQKGAHVTEVLTVDETTAATGGRSLSAPDRSSALPEPAAPEGEALGTVKWYDADKGFGFAGQDDSVEDVFVHATALERSGLTGLTEGQRVRMKTRRVQKGLEARSIELLD